LGNNRADANEFVDCDDDEISEISNGDSIHRLSPDPFAILSQSLGLWSLVFGFMNKYVFRNCSSKYGMNMRVLRARMKRNSVFDEMDFGHLAKITRETQRLQAVAIAIDQSAHGENSRSMPFDFRNRRETFILRSSE